MGEKVNLESLNAKCKECPAFFVLFGFSGARNENSSMSFSNECSTRCETGQVGYFANWKFEVVVRMSFKKYIGINVSTFLKNGDCFVL